jgi:hypothetical protein|tara:strand:+ start:194 stop:544 length:351 start_codon:yes stop_codon:yes gene_type:complete
MQKKELVLNVLIKKKKQKKKQMKNLTNYSVIAQDGLDQEEKGDDMILEVKLFPSSKEVYDNPEWFDIESSSDVLGGDAMARVLVGESSSLEDKEKLKKEYKNLYQVFDKQYKESKG